MKITSGFAIIDVKSGRNALEKHFANRPRMGECPEEMRIPIIITGYIDGIWGGDDGVSREFSIIVEKVKVDDQSS